MAKTYPKFMEDIYNYMETHALDEFISLCDKYPSTMWLKEQTGAILMNNVIAFSERFPKYTDHDLMRYALAIRKAFGTVSPEVVYSDGEDKFMTHLDIVELGHESDDASCSVCDEYSNVCIRLSVAMEKAGFMRAQDVHTTILVSEYCLSSFNYGQYIFDFEYPYELMKQKHAPIAEGLAMYFYNPSRLEVFFQ